MTHRKFAGLGKSMIEKFKHREYNKKSTLFVLSNFT